MSRVTTDMIRRLAEKPAARPLASALVLHLRWLVPVAFAVAFAVGVVGLRPDWAVQVNTLAYLLPLAGWAAVALLAAGSAVLLARPCWPLPRKALMFLTVALGVLALLVATLLLKGEAPGVVTAASWHEPCALVVAALAAAAAIALFRVLRRAAPTSPLLLSLTMGVAASATGMVAIALVCPSAEWGHIMVSHLLPALGAGGGVTLAGLFLNRW